VYVFTPLLHVIACVHLLTAPCAPDAELKRDEILEYADLGKIWGLVGRIRFFTGKKNFCIKSSVAQPPNPPPPPPWYQNPGAQRMAHCLILHQ
jgi:hypothetical protein